MRVHIANTNFEEELSHPESLQNHPIYLQLQFLPLLYADPEDIVLVSELPSSGFLARFPRARLHTFKDEIDLSGYFLESWGYSPRLETFAKKRGLLYPAPTLASVRKAHSKAFAWEHTPKRANSCLLRNEKEAKEWLEKEPYPKVLKKAFSHSGRGHLLLFSPDDAKKVEPFLQGEWKQGLPVRAEKWLDRVFEFSTQWKIEQDQTFSLLGVTVFESSARGSYQKTIVGDQEENPFLEEHLHEARKFLSLVSQEGFFGNIGLDSFVYRKEGRLFLYPITEANARKTMSLAALLFQKRYFPQKKLTFSYLGATEEGLLPSQLGKIRFSKQLIFT